MKDLITVIIPVYQVERYLCRCLDSVLAQTYTNLEIILVDDGSPDRCPAICDEYAGKDDRITVIHQENKGLSGARNAGIDIAKGSYLSFIDSDDFVEPDFLECLYEACVSTGSDLSVCRWEYVKGDRILERSSMPGDITVYTAREMMANFYIQEGAYFVVAWNKLYKRELFWEIRYPVGRIHEDEATTYKIYHQIQKAAFVDRALYGYFVTEDSITRKFNPKRLDWMTAVAERVDFFESRGYGELMPKALKAFADGIIDIYFGLTDNLPGSGAEQRQIRDYVRAGLARVKPYGRFPLSTTIGYHLFIRCPKLYRKLLDRVKSSNGKQ